MLISEILKRHVSGLVSKYNNLPVILYLNAIPAKLNFGQILGFLVFRVRMGCLQRLDFNIIVFFGCCFEIYLI